MISVYTAASAGLLVRGYLDYPGEETPDVKHPTDHRPGSVPATFSVSARDPEADAHGVAVATGLLAAGASAPFVSSRAAVLTQSFTNVSLGRDALALVRDGLSFPTACEALLSDDPHASYRQVHGIDAAGWTFVHTGDDCVEWAGHTTAPNHTVAGNMLVGPEVLDAMSDAVESTDGELTERLLSALRAGEAVGGDKRGSISAAVRVDAPEYHLWHNLRVDYDESPVETLAALYERARETEAALPRNAAKMLGEFPDSIVDFERRWTN